MIEVKDMVEFSRYYINFVSDLFYNIWIFFKTIGEAIYHFFVVNVGEYIDELVQSTKNFKTFDWVVFVIVTAVNIALLFFIIMWLFQLFRKYVNFRRREIEKEELLEEIEILNEKTMELIDERNQIMAMKVSQLGLKPELIELEDGEVEEQDDFPTDSRFVKLVNVDREYRNTVATITMDPNDMIGLPGLVERFVNFSASQLNLYYTRKTIATFFAGMAASKVIILEGISGTGKTSLPYAVARFFNNDASIISVQPSWRDRAELIGYLNEFTKRFNETDFLKSVYECTYRQDINLIVLDEMNLARIEYYFAEFLSIMEMPDPREWKIDIVPDTKPGDPKHLYLGKLTIPQNVWFVGTANKDDSTFTITDKVYDRAMALEFNKRADYFDAPETPSITMTSEYLDSLFKQAQEDYAISSATLENFNKLDEFIQDKFKVAFGNRIMKHINVFVPTFMACGGSELEGLDFMLRSKVLRKFESLNLGFLKEEIDQLINLIERLFGKDTFIESIAYLRELQMSN